MDKEYLKKILQSYGLSANKTYGQNFLLNDLVLVKMIDVAKITKDDAVLEIGPGIGNLTRSLLQSAKFVLAVEKDSKFFPILKAIKKQHKNFRFEFADFLKFNFQEVLKDFESYRVVANIPYFITGKIVKTLLAAKFKPKSITMLVQKEVAQNIVAGPGKLNLLGISVQLYGSPVLVSIVPAGDFYPSPKVDSAILHIELYEKPKYKIADEKKFFKVLRACFAGKRKQLHNTLAHNLGIKKEEVENILTELKIAASIRPQELTIEQWVKLTEKLIL